jgi:uncharacterized protein (TIGR00251 family)
MEILKTKTGVVLKVHVKPRSRSFRIQINDELIIFCRQPPVEGKANRELIKELSKMFERKIKIVSGFCSRIKTISIENATKEEVMKILKI